MCAALREAVSLPVTAGALTLPLPLALRVAAVGEADTPALALPVPLALAQPLALPGSREALLPLLPVGGWEPLAALLLLPSRRTGVSVPAALGVESPGEPLAALLPVPPASPPAEGDSTELEVE